jgi:hypothetical protein
VRACALLLLIACAGCAARGEPARAPAPPVTRSDRFPRRADLPCFPCHSHLVFEKGPDFAHASAGHRNAGHCHLCHQGMGHQGRAIDRTACLACHEDGPPATPAAKGR